MVSGIGVWPQLPPVLCRLRLLPRADLDVQLERRQQQQDGLQLHRRLSLLDKRQGGLIQPGYIPQLNLGQTLLFPFIPDESTKGLRLCDEPEHGYILTL